MYVNAVRHFPEAQSMTWPHLRTITFTREVFVHIRPFNGALAALPLSILTVAPAQAQIATGTTKFLGNTGVAARETVSSDSGRRLRVTNEDGHLRLRAVDGAQALDLQGRR